MSFPFAPKSRYHSFPRKSKKPKKSARPKLRITKFSAPGRSFGFPKQNTVQLRYCTEIQLVESLGTLDLHAFRANGIWDPDVTGTGHQPLGRDQWTDFYNHYKVIGSKIHVTCIGMDHTSAVPVVQGLYVSDDLTVPTSWTTLAESGRGTYNTVDVVSTDKTHLSASFTTSTFFKNQGVNQSQLGSAVGTDPTEQAYYIIYCQAGDEASSFAIRRYNVTIDYLVQWSEPKDLPQS